MSRKIDRTGETSLSNEGCVMKIVEYNNCNDIIIQFQDEHKYRVHTSYQAFKNGQCKNPFYPSAYGHGYLGIDKTAMYLRQKNLKMASR